MLRLFGRRLSALGFPGMLLVLFLLGGMLGGPLVANLGSSTEETSERETSERNASEEWLVEARTQEAGPSRVSFHLALPRRAATRAAPTPPLASPPQDAWIRPSRC